MKLEERERINANFGMLGRQIRELEKSNRENKERRLW